MNEIFDKRNGLRKRMHEERAGITRAQVEAWSTSVCRKLAELEPVRKAKTIMGFAAIKNEVNVNRFLGEEKNNGKTILLPRIESEGVIKAVEFVGWERTKKGQFGIAEPIGHHYDPQSIDIVLVPGLVFDGNGYRLGYGKGYYDRFLPTLAKDAFICGVCYEFQVVENVFPHDNDIPVHWIVTDRSELVIDWQYF